MKLQTDFEPLLNDQPGCDSDPAWPDFVDAMNGKQYGIEALRDAWHWYRVGWHDGVREGGL